MSADWSAASFLTRLVDPGEVDDDLVRGVALVVLEADAELRRPGQVGHQLGGGDQGLAGDAVGHHRRPAEAVAVDHGHLGAELGGHQRGLVAAGSAADDHDAVRLPELGCGHPVIVSHVRCRTAPLSVALVTPHRSMPQGPR